MNLKIFILIIYLFIKSINSDKIPHIIHYAWITEIPQSKPRLIQRCISSWKKYCPDWLIVQWNLENILPFDNIFIKEAFERKKYAFVSDYIRLFAIENFGGVYLILTKF